MSTTLCDHAHQASKYAMSLRIESGVVTAFAAELLDNTVKKLHSGALPGLPSRTRISPGFQLVPFSTFVTREACVRAGFAVAAQMSSRAGHDYGNLATGVEKTIPNKRSIDDQVDWIGVSLCSAVRRGTQPEATATSGRFS